MRQKAKSEAEGIVKNAERQIQLETTRALQQIRQEAIDLSVMIASKIIQKNISKEDNERLIDETLKQVEIAGTLSRLRYQTDQLSAISFQTYLARLLRAVG